MKNTTTVSVKNVSKKYKLFNSPKERLWEALHPFQKKYHHEFWALKGINLEVRKGQTVGIIGRNGSGKSTLLQIICSVLQPTSGTVAVNGKISALLELGAGFNPEFTGRDNVLLNGALMGFSQAEMKERMPLVENFAEIGEFFDQPVKTYSTGMFVRLAFAAAINVDPDILVVDEALAVGDAKFQHKCYQKFIEFQEAGKTILFVTHDTSAIVKHCDHAILLENGTVIESGHPKDVANCYNELLFTGIISSKKGSSSITSTAAKLKSEEQAVKPDQSRLEKFLEEIPATDNCIFRNNYNKNEYRYGDKRAEILDYLVVCGENCDPMMIGSGETIDLYSKAKFYEDIESLVFGFAVKTIDGVVIYGNNTSYMKTILQPFKKSDVVIFKLSMKLDLKAGDYFISYGIAEELSSKHIIIDARLDSIHLSVRENNYFDGLVGLKTAFQEISRIDTKSATHSEEWIR